MRTRTFEEIIEKEISLTKEASDLIKKFKELKTTSGGVKAEESVEYLSKLMIINGKLELLKWFIC